MGTRRPALLAALGCAIACRQAPPPPAEPPLPEDPVVRVSDGGSVVFAPRRPAEGCVARAPRGAWGAGTTHGLTVAGTETWSREGSPHRVPHGLHLLAGASLRVEPCAVVLVGAGRSLVVQGDARLVAEGAADAPIVFDSLAEDPAPGDWAGIELRAHALPDTRLVHAVIAHAGGDHGLPGEPAAALRSRATAGLDVRDTAVRDAAGFGVALLDDGAFARRARELTIAEARGPGALYLADVNAAATLPSLLLRGNARDDVVLAATRRVVRDDLTLRPLGPAARYRLRRAARWIVQSERAPRLTLAPGVTVALEPEASLEVGLDLPGALAAEGDARVGPVRLGPAEADPWGAVVLGARTDLARTTLREMELARAAGLATGAFGACPTPPGTALEARGMLVLRGPAAHLTVTGLRFVDGPRNGFAILRADAPPLSPMDFTRSSPGNDLTRAGVRCAASQPSPEGSCPPTPGCS